MSDHEHSDEQWNRMITGLRTGDEVACAEFWRDYHPLLQTVTEKQLSGRILRRVGSDDVVQSACRTFFRRVQEGQFDLPDADALWRLVCSITLNKARRVARDQSRKKRGVDREQHFNSAQNDGTSPLSNLPDAGHSPIDAVVVADQMQALLNELSESECQIVDLKLQQFTNDEIAEQIGCSERTVRRLLKKLQEKWLSMED